MREIKFRGYGKDAKQWIYGSLLDEQSVGIVAIQDEYCHVYAVEPESVGQYTGLRDAEGREIYEGDIVRFNDELGLVVWRAGEFDIDLQSGPCCIGALACLEMPFGDDDFNKIHVIGNVHDNPDLLEVAHD